MTIWSQPIPYQEADVKSVSANFVAVDIDQNLALYDIKTGSLIWSQAACRNEIQAYVEENTVYVACYGMRAIDVPTGNDEWIIESIDRIAKVGYADGVMYYSPEQDNISAFDLHTRKVLWQPPFTGKGLKRFVPLGEYLAVIDSDQACIIDRETGDRLWSVRSTNPQTPTFIDNAIYVMNGYHDEVTVFDLSSGRRIGDLRFQKLRLYVINEELITSADNILVFVSGHRLYTFSK